MGKLRWLKAISLRCVFADLAYFTAGGARNSIDEDIERFTKWESIQYSKILKLNILLKSNSYRNVFYFRLRKATLVSKTLSLCSRLFFPVCKTIEISGDIGNGLLISHNFAVIMPCKAGKNLRVGPGVVIGRNGKKFPIIGDNVYIASNSTIVGGVKIGNNVIIGAGSVVVRDIPDNSVVVGNPAHVIREINENDYDEIM